MEKIKSNIEVLTTNSKCVPVADTTKGQYVNTVLLDITTYDGKKHQASGFVVGDNAIATCGHCVYNPKWGGWAKNIKVIPACNGASHPRGEYQATDMQCGGNWYEHQNNQDDWGIVLVSKNIGDRVGWLGLRWQSDSYGSKAVQLNGYPVLTIYGENEPPEMFHSTGNITNSSDRTLTGNWISYRGMSGGPLYYYSSSTGYTAIGFCRGNGSNYSDAMRIDEWIYKKFISFR